MNALELRNVSKSYGALRVTQDVSFVVTEGEALGVIGPNGAGKSTLFNLINGNVQPDGGSLYLYGRDITLRPPMERVAAGIGRTFQIPQPFDRLSVFENLLVAATHGRSASERDVADDCIDILDRTGLLHRANTLAGGLTLLDRKRLELARAVATSPKILLLDEIAGGLTEGECQTLVQTIRDFHASGMTIVWIEHVLHALTSVVSRIVVLDFGKLIAQGTPDEVMAHRDVQQVYLGVEP